MSSKTRRIIAGIVAIVVGTGAIGALVAWAAPESEGAHREFHLEARSDVLHIDDGVTFDGFTFNGTMPGPQKVVNEGDTVEITVENTDTVAHGLSMHAIDGQTSNYLGNIEAGDTATLTFEADDPGIFMYHCAPGGHGIMAHTMGGQHGMFVVMPDEPYQMEQELGREPDVEIFVVQHEVYKDGRDFFDGNAQYVMFNGEAFRYVKDPIQVRPDDYVRFYYLNNGPNLTSTFHAVGGIWDYIYYGGVPENKMQGTQSVVSGPTDSWTIEWKVPDEGPFTLVTHAFGTQAIKGAIGIIESSEDAERDELITSEGPATAPAEDPKRHVAPFGLGSEDLDRPHRFRDGDEIYIEMVGNSFVPKRAEVPVGSTVTFVNEDVFDMLEGELTGKHDAVVVEADGDENFATELLDHAETESVTFQEPGTYEYICSIHPYMRGEITVYDPADAGGPTAAGGTGSLGSGNAPEAPGPEAAAAPSTGAMGLATSHVTQTGGTVARAPFAGSVQAANGATLNAPGEHALDWRAAELLSEARNTAETAPGGFTEATANEARREIRRTFGLDPELTSPRSAGAEADGELSCH